MPPTPSAGQGNPGTMFSQPQTDGQPGVGVVCLDLGGADNMEGRDLDKFLLD